METNKPSKLLRVIGNIIDRNLISPYEKFVGALCDPEQEVPIVFALPLCLLANFLLLIFILPFAAFYKVDVIADNPKASLIWFVLCCLPLVIVIALCVAD